MTRKLFSLTLSAFALLLLMGAGVEQSSAALVSESDGTAAEAAVRQVDAEQDQEADRAEPVPAVAGGSVLTLVENLDRTLTVDGEPVKLTPIEYNILLLLVKNQGKVFSISQIYESIWNEDAIGADNTVAVHIRHIREKIEINPKEPRYLKVVWGVGYKIEKQ